MPSLGSFSQSLGMILAVAVAAGPAAAQRKPAPKPAALEYKSITMTPENLVLDGPRLRQQLMVTGVKPDGTAVDLTHEAKIASKNPRVAIVHPGGVVQPASDGEVEIVANVNGQRAVTKLTTRNVNQDFTWNFNNHVISVLSKAGCNMGACHGAAAGKNGFRLTLRGYDPDLDYDWMLYEAGGRRIQRSEPGDSLLLKKATMAVPHAGGMRFKPGSLEYRVLAEWIASGLPGPSSEAPRMVDLQVHPAERVLTPEATQQLRVEARFSDGRIEDVTHWARYSSNEESIASVDESGIVTTEGVGETAITVSYLGQVTFARMTVPFANNVSVAQYRAVPRSNYIDDLVLAKLQQLRIVPSPISSDDEYLRRVYLDIIGTLPTPDEVRAFLANPSPNKRERLVEELFERPEYVDFWTYKWADLLRVNRETLTEKGMWAFYSWLRDSVAQNKPWNTLVEEVLTANGSNFADGPSNFYRIGRNPEDLTETVSQAFLGIRVSCAKCHNHPFEKWTQADYFKFANHFSRINRKQGEHPADLVITAAAGGEINFPKTGKPLPPTPYDGEPMALDAGEDRRVVLAEWLTAADNEFFVRAIVNRVWRHYLGRGLIEPVDDLRATNPASNEPLMEALSDDLVKNGFDLKHLMRRIVNSRTYQLTSRPLPENQRDDRLYSRYLVKRLTAEQLLDAICQVTEQPEKFNGLPMGQRAIQLPDTRVANYFLDVFGRPPRQITCDCERAQEPNMAQALHLINGEGVNRKISADNGRVARLIREEKSDRQIIEDLYLSCFGRFPSAEEMQTHLELVRDAMDPAKQPAPAAPAEAPAPPAPAEGQPAEAQPEAEKKEEPAFDPAQARRQALEDLLWALINGKEFVFNH
jgi:hypothetical protein